MIFLYYRKRKSLKKSFSKLLLDSRVGVGINYKSKEYIFSFGSNFLGFDSDDKFLKKKFKKD